MDGRVETENQRESATKTTIYMVTKKSQQKIEKIVESQVKNGGDTIKIVEGQDKDKDLNVKNSEGSPKSGPIESVLGSTSQVPG